MNFDILHIILAMLGLSFLVFIHELGHYLVAKRVGMRVEVFSIGFGKPIYTWMKDGVKWQVCYLLFGGYVKIAGMEKEGGVEPHLIKDGFFGKKPIDRIKVAIMGPLVNIVFAFLIFTMIWVLGGREKRFEEFTNIIGWVDPTSELIQKGVKPGDTITEYGGKKFTGFKDLIYGGVLNSDTIEIQGDKVNYFTNDKVPYQYDLQGYPMQGALKGIKTIGVVPANYVIFGGFDPKMGQFSPAYGSGIQQGDRVVWANGEPIFSALELTKVVNRDDVYLAVERDHKVIHLRVPRVLLDDLQLTLQQKDEFLDWKRALGMNGAQEELYFIPYEIDVLGVVKDRLSYIDYDLMNEENLDTKSSFMIDQPLQRNDRILAVNGQSVANGLEIFSELRANKVLLVVLRNRSEKPVLWTDANSQFIESVNWKDLEELTENIGTPEALSSKGNLVLLRPIEPKTYEQFLSLGKKGKEDYELKIAKGIKHDHKSPQYLFVGSGVSDQRVIYNPSPVQVFQDVILETWHTVSSLVTGSLSPKWLSGPVGIVKVIEQGLGIGVTEALYWMGLISLNLGIINLLPIPVLDGGHICFSLFEMITKKRISSKALEKIVFPFVVLMVAFFIYVTFQDIIRLFL
ncbi:MAG: peptidase [Chlamydiae bacterium]|jgi:regulator of sigma E protease|nr:peptidase [Chlamydiota bacterium]